MTDPRPPDSLIRPRRCIAFATNSSCTRILIAGLALALVFWRCLECWELLRNTSPV
jgi:hypothetical protein